MTIKLTPSEDLAIDVLLARYRTGERLWTFDKMHRKTFEKLEARGLVRTMHGTVENSFRASLTDAALKEYIGEGYISPIEKKLATVEKERDAALTTVGSVTRKNTW